MEKYILKILLSINILLFIFLLTKNEGLIHYNTINKQHKILQTQLNNSQSILDNLKNTNFLLHNNYQYQEKIIREEFSYTKEKEMVIIDK